MYDKFVQQLQSFKYELMPNGQQEWQIRKFAGACRFVFNKALALQLQRYRQGESKLSYAELCKLLTQWRNSAATAWLADAPAQLLQQKLWDLEQAYANFFAKRANFPRFKKKEQSNTFSYPDAKRVKLDQANSRLYLPKLGWLRYRNSRNILGSICQVTVSTSKGKSFVSIVTKREVEQPIQQPPSSGSTWGSPASPHCLMAPTSNHSIVSKSINKGLPGINEQ